MKGRVGSLIALTAVILLAAVYGVAAFNAGHYATLPFAIRDVNAHTGVIVPVRGVALPERLRADDHIDLARQPFATRIAIATGGYAGQALPSGQVYHFIVQRGSARIPIAVRTIGWDTAPVSRSIQWLTFFVLLFSAVIALVVVWRGRNRAAAGIGLFAIATVVGASVGWTPLQGKAGLALFLGQSTLFLLARAGFYVMAVSMAGAALSQRARRGWRAGFLVVLGAGAMVALGGPLVYVATGWGWADLLPRSYGLILAASYLVPVALLFIGYHRAVATDRARLRWMLWGGGLFAVGILLMDTGVQGQASSIAGEGIQALAMAVFLYAILRHRVVDVKVVISRTLVYAMTTSLVLGLFALFESLIERTTLGHRASLVLELAVPLGLGVSLSTVHRRIDTLVDRLVFRRQYREELALRTFANESAFVNHPETLLDLAVEQILLHVGAPWVAFYEYGSADYRRVRQRGEVDLPATVATDDLALVKLRAHDSDVDLHETPSSLGAEGHVFPLRARDQLLGLLVVGPRPGERYAAEERDLMAHVVHAVGASLFALRARATEEQLNAAREEIEAGATRLDAARAETAARLAEARAQARINEALLSDSRARESALLDALRALGAEPRIPAER